MIYKRFETLDARFVDSLMDEERCDALILRLKRFRYRIWVGLIFFILFLIALSIWMYESTRTWSHNPSSDMPKWLALLVEGEKSGLHLTLIFSFMLAVVIFSIAIAFFDTDRNIKRLLLLRALRQQFSARKD